MDPIVTEDPTPDGYRTIPMPVIWNRETGTLLPVGDFPRHMLVPGNDDDTREMTPVIDVYQAGGQWVQWPPHPHAAPSRWRRLWSWCARTLRRSSEADTEVIASLAGGAL
ncbi:hypothetical protein ORV05_04690 [Amycolatopsis cynarae]|uniref:Uncharacterized protein n=1 Tax=Amycolatopsis cynarae TaxID=2995223 RepID=A0ABY7B8M6_9PSEU|nr:hypothetical protein [Amycolatopsis sp. HUAS 11-8]WAL67088.1 hypothetical protein ORV05_04690 [Amycolatopsis sp. HUAS 11-8]